MADQSHFFLSVIPVFSIRTKKSLGIGEFLDVKMMAHWAKLAGISLIQVPPLPSLSFPFLPPILCAFSWFGLSQSEELIM